MHFFPLSVAALCGAAAVGAEAPTLDGTTCISIGGGAQAYHGSYGTGVMPYGRAYLDHHFTEWLGFRAAGGAAKDFGFAKVNDCRKQNLYDNWSIPVELGLEYLVNDNLAFHAWVEDRVHSTYWDKIDGVRTGSSYINHRDEVATAGLGLTFRFGGKHEPPPAPVYVPPSDADHDGVYDYKDKCPNSAPGAKVDSTGCVEIKIEKGKHITLDGIYFATGKAKVNKAFSAKRANAVKAYLVKLGVPAKQITAKGYGPAQPKADNKTEEGRAQNRRIEFCVK